MGTRPLSWRTSGLLAATLTGLLLVVPFAPVQAQRDKLELNKIPKVMMDALSARFPNAEIHQWTREKEGDLVIYDIEFRQGGRKCEADIKEDGTYHNFEREIAAKDLPQAVKQAVEKK